MFFLMFFCLGARLRRPGVWRQKTRLFAWATRTVYKTLLAGRGCWGMLSPCQQASTPPTSGPPPARWSLLLFVSAQPVAPKVNRPPARGDQLYRFFPPFSAFPGKFGCAPTAGSNNGMSTLIKLSNNLPMGWVGRKGIRASRSGHPVGFDGDTEIRHSVN